MKALCAAERAANVKALQGARTPASASSRVPVEQHICVAHACLLADTLLAAKEGAPEQGTGHWHAIVYEISIDASYEQEVLRSCKLDFDLPDGDKKGLEGAEYIDKGDDGEFLLGICEGNYCEARACWLDCCYAHGHAKLPCRERYLLLRCTKGLRCLRCLHASRLCSSAFSCQQCCLVRAPLAVL